MDKNVKGALKVLIKHLTKEQKIFLAQTSKEPNTLNILSKSEDYEVYFTACTNPYFPIDKLKKEIKKDFK